MSQTVRKTRRNKENVAPSHNDVSAFGDLTVEAYLNQECEKLIQTLQDRSNQHIQRLREEFEAGKKEIMRQMPYSSSKSGDEKEEEEEERTWTQTILSIEVTTGPHVGITKEVVAKNINRKRSIKVGRSHTASFKKNNISLPDDEEISTTHLRFDILHGVVFVTDTGSTNGTLLNGTMMEREEQVALNVFESPNRSERNEHEVEVGSSLLRVTIRHE